MPKDEKDTLKVSHAVCLADLDIQTDRSCAVNEKRQNRYFKESKGDLTCGKFKKYSCENDRTVEVSVQICAIEPCGQGESVRISYEVRSPSGILRENTTVLLEQYSALHLKTGKIDKDTYYDLLDAGVLYSAVRKAINFLSFGDKSAKMLEYKLRFQGYSSSAAVRAVEYLKIKGYLHEHDSAVRRATLCAEKHWGILRIRRELRSQGFCDEAIEIAMDSLAEYDFHTSCCELIRKKYGVPKDQEDYRKLIAALARYGYTYDEIKRAVGELSKKQ